MEAEADDTAVDSLLSSLSGLKQKKDLPDEKDLKSFGLDQPKLEVAVKLDDGKEQGVQIGTDNSFDNTLYAKKLGDSTVRVVDAYQKTALEKTAFDLRDKKVAHLDDAAELKRIDVAGVKSPYVLEKDGNTWKVNGAAADAGAADRVASALFQAVVEGLEFGPRDLPRAEDREWIRGIIAVPLQEAADAALQVLAWSVSRAMERAPNGLLERFERSHHLEYLGIE